MEQITSYVQKLPCSGGGELTVWSGANEETYCKLLDELNNDGWTLAERRMEGKNEFAVLSSSMGVATVSRLPKREMIRLIVQPGEDLPANESGESICSPLLTQVKLCYFTDDCGMTYVIRLRDGRFILIDGGVGRYDEGQQLMDILRAQNVLPEIRIAAWFISHPHGDHFGGFLALMEQFGGEVRLDKLLFNWPNPDMTGPFSPMERFNALIAAQNISIQTPHSGQRFGWPGAEIDVMFACDDLYPERIGNLNDSSLVLRLTMEGRRVLFPGDASAQASAELCARYSAESLACEFLQVPHHGYWGGSDELFRRIDPEILLWPCPDFWYQVIRDWDCNRFLKESPHIRERFVAGQQEITLDMTQAVPAAQPYPDIGKTLLDERFAAGSLVGLNWTCVTGGSTGYRPLVVEFPRVGQCRLTGSEARSVCTLLQGGALSGCRGITLTLTGQIIRKPSLLGLWWNHPIPTEWTDEDIYVLDGDEGELKLSLHFDFADRPESGLYLLMQGGEILLTHVACIAD